MIRCLCAGDSRAKNVGGLQGIGEFVVGHRFDLAAEQDIVGFQTYLTAHLAGNEIVVAGFSPISAGLVVKLRDLKLVEEFAGADGRLRFATTEAFLQRFGLASLQELTAASVSPTPSPIQPLI